MLSTNNLDDISKYLGDFEIKNEEAMFFCPRCTANYIVPFPTEWKPKFYVNIITGRYHCWVCDLGGSPLIGETPSNCLKRLLRKLGHTEIVLEDSRYLSERNIDNLFNEPAAYVPPQVKIADHYKKIYKFKNSFMYKSGYDFLKRRNITDDDMIKYDIRYSIVTQRVLFPSYDERFVLNYFVTRTIHKNVFPKYVNCVNRKNDIIFNEFMIEWNKELFLTEGVFDCISLRKNAVPILGCQLSRHSLLFKRILKHHTPINLILDYDMKAKMFRIAKFLSGYGIIVKFFDWKELKKDIDEFSEEEREFFLTHNIKEYDFENEILFSLTS